MKSGDGSTFINETVCPTKHVLAGVDVIRERNVVLRSREDIYHAIGFNYRWSLQYQFNSL